MSFFRLHEAIFYASPSAKPRRKRPIWRQECAAIASAGPLPEMVKSRKGAEIAGRCEALGTEGTIAARLTHPSL